MGPRSDNSKDKQDLPFEFRRRPVEGRLREENWNAVSAEIRHQAENPVQQGPTPVRRMIWLRFLAVAASLTAVVFGIWYIKTCTGKPQMSELRTGFGEIKHIVLPDSSVVVLNANSSIRIPQQWKEDEGRQVWLEGEAYFQVQKKPAGALGFTVHTRQVDVEVLGTRFNVNTRREHSVVSLEEGKVRLSVSGQQASVVEKKEPVIMEPGQVAVVSAAEGPRVNSQRDVTTLSGWSRNEFHFDNTPLSDVARMIEDAYGYKMEVSDTTLLRRAVSGDLRAANVQELVKVLEFSLKLQMRVENKTIYVTNR